MVGFNRSAWMTKRWATSRTQKEFYKNKFHEDLPTSEFFKTDNKLTQNIIKYKVTFEMSNTEKDYEFFIPQGSYTIYALRGVEDKNVIEQNTKDQIVDLFKGGAREYVDNRVDVTVKEQTIRGIEEEPLKYGEVDYELLKSTNSYTKDTPQVNVKKTRKLKTLFDEDYDIRV